MKINFAGVPSYASQSTPAFLRPKTTVGFTTALDFPCGMAIDIPIPVVLSFSRLIIAFLNLRLDLMAPFWSADFVMSRGKNRGRVTEYLLETRNKFANIGKMNTALKIEEIFSFKEIKNGINQVLVDCQLKGLSNEQINDLIVCIISILQHVKITENGREIGRLFFAIASKQVMLMAEAAIMQNGIKKTNAVFPVLTAKNNYVAIKKQDKYDAPYFFEEKVIEITNQGGEFEITFVGSEPHSAKV
jgi:hypothetical protein